MNLAPKMFSPDARNLGGRKIIVNQLYKHLNSIENASSAINIKPAHSPRIEEMFNSNFSQKNTFANEVLQTFQKVQQIRNSKKRSSTDKFKNNYYVATPKLPFQQIEHTKNLFNSQKRISEIGNLQNRKKNKQDYLIYPSFFFRRVEKSQMKNINHTSPSQLGKAPVAGKANTSSDKKKQDVKVLLNKYNWEKVFFEIAAKTGCEWETESNEGSAKEITHHIATLTSNRDQLKNPYNQDNGQEIDWPKIAKEVPVYTKQNIGEFQNRVLQIIVENRLYSDDDYAFLICLISSVNMSIPQERILEAFQGVLRLLEQ